MVGRKKRRIEVKGSWNAHRCATLGHFPILFILGITAMVQFKHLAFWKPSALANSEQHHKGFYFLAVTLKHPFLLPVEPFFGSFPEFPARVEHSVQNWSCLLPLWESRLSLRKFAGLEGPTTVQHLGQFSIEFDSGKCLFSLFLLLLKTGFQKEITSWSFPLPSWFVELFLIPSLYWTVPYSGLFSPNRCQS